MSDELRDPLTVVRSAGHTLGAHGSSLSPEARSGLIDRLCGQAGRLQQIVDVVLDFSRFQATHRVSRQHWVDLQTVVAPFRDHLEVAASDPGDRDLDVRIHIDGELLRYALALLLEEAQGPLTLTIDAQEVVLTVDDGVQVRSPLTRSLIEQLILEAGATLEATDPATIQLPRFDLAQDVRV